ncbi:MAG: hypothetical protein IJ565_03715 [Bacilli bacterium]|nr:hypothetical protein [Bacilli bacterium]
MSIGIMFIIITALILFVMWYNKRIDLNKFIYETQPYFMFLKEDDYEFLLSIKYKTGDLDVNKLYGQRVRNGLITIVALIFLFLQNFKFVYALIALAGGYIVFKSSYTSLKNYYKANLHQIDQMLPYYLKSLEILIQHYTVPVALSRSIDTAPEIFKPGLRRLVQKIEAGDSSVDPYMDFAKEYPVRDSMRMMRLLYRLGLGSQERKEEQLMMFSRTVSTLQNKSREQKYQERLDGMEKRTMIMLFVTGGGILGILLFAMMSMMNL